MGDSSVIYHKVFSTQPEQSLAALSELMRVVGQHGAPEETISDMEIVLNEVINNITEHAYSQQPDNPVWIWVCKNENGFGFHLKDKGRAMPQVKIPTVAPHDLNCAVSDYPEGGFGLQLIRLLSSNLQYKREGQDNHLSFDLVT